MDETQSTSEATDQAEVASRAIGVTTSALGSWRDEVNSGYPYTKLAMEIILGLARGSIGDDQQTRPSWPLPNLLMITTHQVKKPLATLRVPVNNFVSSVVPTEEFAWPCHPAKSSICCQKCCSATKGASRNMRRCSRRGTPSGSFAAQLAAGPDTAVPNATTKARTAATSKRAPSTRGTRSLARKRSTGLSSRESAKAKTSGHTISAAM